MEARRIGSTVECLGTTYIFDTIEQAERFYICLQEGNSEDTCRGKVAPNDVFKSSSGKTFGL